MSKIMERPKGLDDESMYGLGRKCLVSYWKGSEVMSRFYNVRIGYGSLHTDYIPEELKRSHWKPEKDRTYKCWWFWTNPSDPSDPGEDILVYIEDMEEDEVGDMKDDLLLDIKTRIRNMDIEKLKRLKEYIENYC